MIEFGISLLLYLCFLMNGMTNADADMQEEINTYISKGHATFSVLILVCTEISSLLSESWNVSTIWKASLNMFLICFLTFVFHKLRHVVRVKKSSCSVIWLVTKTSLILHDNWVYSRKMLTLAGFVLQLVRRFFKALI